jgi:streptogramin lyase
VLQSGVVSDSLLWLVLNNSGKIVAVDPSTFVFKKEIKGLKSPRFLLSTGNGEAWVTDLYENHISILDLRNAKIKSQVPCPAWTENLLISGSEIAVSSSVGKLYWFDKSTGQLKDSTGLRTGSKWLQQDKNGDIWALASDSGKSVLYRINSTNHSVEKALSFTGAAMKLAMNPGKDSLYFLADGVFAMPVNASLIPTVPIFSESTFTYYGIAVNPKNGNVYVGNARDYVSKGEVVVLKSSGGLIHRFACGINPGDFVFQY